MYIISTARGMIFSCSDFMCGFPCKLGFFLQLLGKCPWMCKVHHQLVKVTYIFMEFDDDARFTYNPRTCWVVFGYSALE